MKWSFGKKQVSRTGLIAVHVEQSGETLLLSAAYSAQKPDVQEIEAVIAEPCKNEKEVEATLTRFVSTRKLEGIACSYVLLPTEYSLTLMEAPSVPVEEMAQAMRWLVQEIISFPVVEASIDTIELPLPRARDNVKMVYAVIMRRSVVPKIEHLVKASGLKLGWIDIPELALNNLIKLYANTDQYLIFIQIQPKGGHLILSRNGLIYMVRTIDIKFAEVLGSMVTPQIEQSLDGLVTEVKRMIDYFTNLFREANFDSVVIFPSILNLSLIKETLNKKLDLEVIVLELDKILPFQAPISDEVRANAILSIGAALRRDELL